MKILTPSPAELTLGRAATPIAFIRAIVTGYRRMGMDPASALAQAQIPPALLDAADARVTAAQMEVMSGLAMQALDDEALGWFSRRLPWGSYGMLCRASLTAPTLEGPYESAWQAVGPDGNVFGDLIFIKIVVTP